MGIAQQSMQGLATTALAAGAAIGKISSDIDKANVAKAEEADSLQDQYLKNKEGILEQENILNDPEKLKVAGSKPGRGPNVMNKETGQMETTGRTMNDIEAAKKALQSAEEKKLALSQRNERIATRFQKLTRTPIIGGKK